MTRAAVLFARVHALTGLGDGPWLWAASGRLMAATGLEPPTLPWYADAGDVTAISVAYWRERGRAGYYNRSWRKRARYARHVLEGNDGAYVVAC